MGTPQPALLTFPVCGDHPSGECIGGYRHVARASRKGRGLPRGRGRLRRPTDSPLLPAPGRSPARADAGPVAVEQYQVGRRSCGCGADRQNWSAPQTPAVVGLVRGTEAIATPESNSASCRDGPHRMARDDWTWSQRTSTPTGRPLTHRGLQASSPSGGNSGWIGQEVVLPRAIVRTSSAASSWSVVSLPASTCPRSSTTSRIVLRSFSDCFAIDADSS